MAVTKSLVVSFVLFSVCALAADSDFVGEFAGPGGLNRFSFPMNATTHNQLMARYPSAGRGIQYRQPASFSFGGRYYFPVYALINPNLPVGQIGVYQTMSSGEYQALIGLGYKPLGATAVAKGYASKCSKPNAMIYHLYNVRTGAHYYGTANSQKFWETYYDSYPQMNWRFHAPLGCNEY